MTVRLDGRVALITGAGAGLGKAYALLFAQLGAKVVVNDLGSSLSGDGQSTSAADTVVEEIKAAGGEAVANYDSVTDAEGAKRMVQTAIDSFGRIDIVINNAGIIRDTSFAKMTAEDYAAVMNVHVVGAFNVTHAAWPHMLAQEYGRIIFTTSGSGHNGSFGQSNYGAAKMALVGMMNNLAYEGARKNVLVNAISPAAVTRMNENIPIGDLGNFMKIDSVPPAAAWLASEDCKETATILVALAGHYAKVQYVKSEGVLFDAREPITVDMIADSRDKIISLEGAKPVKPNPLGDITDRLKAAGYL